MSVSSCCGASPRGNGDSDSRDLGICPDCGEHCDYVNDDDFDENGELIEKTAWRNAEHYERIKQVLSLKLVDARTKCMMTQDDVARRLGVSRMDVIRAECKEGDFMVMLRYADVMSINVTVSIDEP